MSKHSEKASLVRIADAVEAQRDTSYRDTSHVDPRKSEKLPFGAKLALWYNGGDAVHRKNLRQLEQFGIVGIVGPNGGGKSLRGVSQVLHSLDQGRPVLSTVPILDHTTGQLHPLYTPFTDFDQLLDARGTTIYADEIVGIANSRDAAAGKLNTDVQNKLMQQRKFDNQFIWTAPAWDRADKIIRQVTQAVIECRGYFSGPQVEDENGRLRMWRPKRVFRFATYDMLEFDAWTAGKREKAKPLASMWFKGVGSREFASYDTLGAVSMVSHASAEGVCDSCGGYVARKRCTCGNSHERRASDAELRALVTV